MYKDFILFGAGGGVVVYVVFRQLRMPSAYTLLYCKLEKKKKGKREVGTGCGRDSTLLSILPPT